MFRALDHAAIVVADTGAALSFYRDKLGLSVVFSEVLEEQGVRLTHLDLGNSQLQLVEPLTESHPLQETLRLYGERIYHLCFAVDRLSESLAELKSQGVEEGVRSYSRVIQLLIGTDVLKVPSPKSQAPGQ